MFVGRCTEGWETAESESCIDFVEMSHDFLGLAKQIHILN